MLSSGWYMIAKVTESNQRFWNHMASLEKTKKYLQLHYFCGDDCGDVLGDDCGNDWSLVGHPQQLWATYSIAEFFSH